MYVALSSDTLFNICDVTTVQLSYGTVHIFSFFSSYFFMKMHLPSSFILRYMYVRAEMNMHAFTVQAKENAWAI